MDRPGHNQRRRDFVKAAGTLVLAVSTSTSAEASEKGISSGAIRHAVIGPGGMGRNHVRIIDSFDGCEVVAVCDVDPERIALGLREHSNPDQVQAVNDYRILLADPTIHSISIATPDHWHAPMALAALVAGKHVYVEKPCCHNIREGALLMAAAKRLNLCVQHGTQQRNEPGIRKAIQFLHDGGIGKVRTAKAINHQFRGPIGRAPVSEPPAEVDYDKWLGPAPKQPFTRNRWHYNWHWTWDFGTGDMGNDGVHQLDVARWGLNVGLPKAISASGGQLFYDDDHETPDTQNVTFEYDDCYLQFEMRLWTNYKLAGHDNGVFFYGDKGTLEISRFGTYLTLIGEERKQLSEGLNLATNMRNFMDCVKVSDPSGLNAPIAEGAPSAMLVHLGNIATRLGRRLHFNPSTYRFIEDDEANRLVTREYRAGYELPPEILTWA